MQCFAYKSLRKADAYVYLARRDDLEALPPAAREVLGELAYVLEFELTPQRRLPRIDAGELISSLSTHGFYIQMPPPVAAIASSMPGQD